MGTAGIRSALPADPIGSAVTRLRTWAGETAEEISLAAGAEYRAGRAARDRAPGRFPAVDGTVAPLPWVLILLLLAVAGGGSGPADERRPVGGADLRRAPERWRQALLERGVLPSSHRRLLHAPALNHL